MSMLNELNSLLEKIPVWRELTQLPKKVAALEARIKELENLKELTKYKGLLWEKNNPLPICPKCKETMSRFEEISYDCTCGFFTDYCEPPDKGMM